MTGLYRSSCNSAPPSGTLSVLPEFSPPAEWLSRLFPVRAGTDMCMSSSLPLYVRTQWARRTHPNSTRWGTHDSPQHLPTGSYCLYTPKTHKGKNWKMAWCKKSHPLCKINQSYKECCMPCTVVLSKSSLLVIMLIIDFLCYSELFRSLVEN